MIRDIFKSFNYYFDGISKVRRFGLTSLLFIPILLSGVIGLIVLYFSYQYSDDLGTWISNWYSFDTGKVIIEFIARIIGGIAIFVFGMFVFRYLVIIILSPFFSYLSEKLSDKLRLESNQDKLDGVGWINGILRGLNMSISYGLKEVGFLVLALLLAFIPLIGWVSPIIIILIEAYFIGVTNLDFALESRKGFKETKYFLKRNRGLIFGNGLVGLILLLIPFVGIFITPALGVCAATIAIHEALD